MLILLFIQWNLFNKNNKPENLPQFLNRGGEKHSGPESSRHKDVREDKTQADEENILTDDVTSEKNKCHKCFLGFFVVIVQFS